MNCTEDNLPINPYDGLDYGDTTLVIDTVSATSFVKLHRDVLGPSCNVMGCHDGSFEPDFRTVESAYNTLVFHDIIKNNLAEDFTYRVVPGDTALSVLHERLTNCCFVNTNDRMPQDNIGNALPEADLNAVTAWILDGAKDITGATPNEPNNLPNVKYYTVMNALFDSTYSDNRAEFYMPFLMPANEIVNFIFRVTDDKTKPADMEVNQLKIYLTADYIPNNQPLFTSTANVFESTYKVWILEFDTSVLQSGETYFMRYTINDGDNPTNTIYPNNNTSFVYKNMWSFTVQ